MKKFVVPLVVTLLVLAILVKKFVSPQEIHFYIPWTVLQLYYSNRGEFDEYQLPSMHTRWLYDFGVVDANADGFLDIYTTNHNWQQTLLLSDGKGGYKQGEWSAWGAGQDRDFPGLELSLNPPLFDRPGLYIYWLNEDLIVRAHRLERLGGARGKIRVFLDAQIQSHNGFNMDFTVAESKRDDPIDTSITFSSEKDGALILRHSPEFPVRVVITEPGLLPHVYVGRKKTSPTAQEFSLKLRDRHAAAWADYNGDGRPDIFINRDAMSGSLRALPDEISREVKDELLLSTAGKGFQDRGEALGLSKNACNGRHASWVDFDSDGRLDLFVNCQDMGRGGGEYPKQLYRQLPTGQLKEMAAEVGLAMPRNVLRAFRWLDVDIDGDSDLFAHQDNGFVLYRNHGGRFTPEFIYRGRFVMADRPRRRFEAAVYLRYDGQISVADFDGNGYPDLFVSSKMGNAVFENDNGQLTFRESASLGLPSRSVAASWADYNNDGRPDLHAVPQGLFAQTGDHRFRETSLLVLPSNRYMAAIVNWFDFDNDGRRDVSVALIEDPGFRRWWELGPEEVENWTAVTYRNVGERSHWLQVDLRGSPGNRQALGARVAVVTPNGEQVQEVGANEGSAQSQGHYRLYFGLGPLDRVDAVRVLWPDGRAQELAGVAADQILVIERDRP